jgi:DNA modification methylase
MVGEEAATPREKTFENAKKDSKENGAVSLITLATYIMGKNELIRGDCLEVMRGMGTASVDAVVTDPPYGLSFMGKKWDYDVPSEEIWRECLRVLKPGGHLLAFAGTRTQHRMAVRIEDAGFEIRDMIAWVYGSGFPKSLDVSKAIDKCNGEAGRLLKFTAWMRKTGLSSRQIDQITGTSMGGHYLTAASQPAIPTVALWKLIRPLCGDVPAWVDELVQRIEAEREVVGQQRGTMLAVAPGRDNDRSSTTLDLTAPATDAARQWQGWGTALKPALEPITVARKPLEGTVAANVLAHGTGGLNVDGCRVGTEGATKRSGQADYPRKDDGTEDRSECWARSGHAIESVPQGRWPANLIHDGSDEVVGLFPQRDGAVSNGSKGATGIYNGGWGAVTQKPGRADSGSAARFFYCAKASKKDREAGLDAFEQRTAGEVTGGRAEGSAGLDNPRAGAGRISGAKNHHPTVKPTDLMRYLCRLVTPPGGVVLDPFMGSGSTGKAALLEGFQFIGIEREAEYLEIAKARILGGSGE